MSRQSVSLKNFISRYWLEAALVLIGLYVVMPFLAPIFMHFGQTNVGKAIYFFYSFQCHMLPQRTWFLFGPQLTYSLGEIHSASQATLPIWSLREFLGTPDMGWKVAQCERSTVMYASLWLFALAYRLVGLPRTALRPNVLFILLIPLALDGMTHFINDLVAPLGGGFRDTNTWLSTLTNHVFADSFYIGDGLGSFNSWMRMSSGVLFGFAIPAFSLPRLRQIPPAASPRQQLSNS